MMGHTKEPLHIDGKLTTAPWGDGTSAFNCCNIVSVEHEIVIAADVEAMTAVRLADCWNAFEGIDDPAAFMADVREYMGPLNGKTPDNLAFLHDRILGALGD